jgi:hypothetical protein
MSDLTHFNELSLAYEDLSLDLNDYVSDVIEFRLGSGNVHYVGYYKPFTKLYIELDDPNVSSADLAYEYWNGTAWVALSAIDETRGLAKSNFISWNFATPENITNQWKQNDVNGLTQYWVRLTATTGVHGSFVSTSLTGNTESILNVDAAVIANYSVDKKVYIDSSDSYHIVTNVDDVLNQVTVSPAAALPFADGSNVYNQMLMRGFNVVFSNDLDLVEKYRNIFNFKQQSDLSFIAYHQATQKKLIQKIRNQGKIKQRENEDFYRNVNKLDILQFDNEDELRQASAHYTLALIFKNASDSVDGKWRQLEKDHEIDGDNAFNLFMLRVDRDDDGQVSSKHEQKPITTSRIYRI